jgi:hypothetical protein
LREVSGISSILTANTWTTCASGVIQQAAETNPREFRQQFAETSVKSVSLARSPGSKLSPSSRRLECVIPQVNMLRIVQLLQLLLLIFITIVAQGIQFMRLAFSSRAALSAEVLFLRKQLAFYREHQISPRRLTVPARFSLVLWSRFFHWREASMIVKPATLRVVLGVRVFALPSAAAEG